MSKIQDALNSFGGNFARPTKYNVMVTLPGLMGGNAPEVVDILCKTVSQPEISHTAIDMHFKGHKISYPGRVNQAQTVSMTFYVDEGYQIYDIFKDWINLMDNKYYGQGNLNETVAAKYGDIVLTLVDYKEGIDVKTSLFEGVFPLNISDMSYDATNKDVVQEYTVQFAYFRVSDNSNALRGFSSDAIGAAAMSSRIMKELSGFSPSGNRSKTRSSVESNVAQFGGEVNVKR